MNWYFEEQGISHGPITEETLIAKIKGGELAVDVLVWQPEMKEWTELEKIKPEWVRDAGPTKKASGLISSPVLHSESSGNAKDSPAKHADDPPMPLRVSRPPLRVIGRVDSKDNTPFSKLAPSTAIPEHTKLKPKAPVEAEAEGAPKSGLLKRVFGLGGKKK